MKCANCQALTALQSFLRNPACPSSLLPHCTWPVPLPFQSLSASRSPPLASHLKGAARIWTELTPRKHPCFLTATSPSPNLLPTSPFGSLHPQTSFQLPGLGASASLPFTDRRGGGRWPASSLEGNPQSLSFHVHGPSAFYTWMCATEDAGPRVTP